MRHMYVIGQTGTGKTTIPKNMIVQDILAGHGVALSIRTDQTWKT